MEFSKRLEGITPSATLKIIAKVNELREKGENVISFGAGEPDFDTPLPIREAAKKAIDDGFTHYTSASGIVELKDAIINKLLRDNGLKYTRDNIIVSNGAKHSLYNALAAILNPKDEVIFANPYWVSYSEMVKLLGGVPVLVDTSFDNCFKLTAEAIEKKITSKTKAIIINTPNNPTGSVMSREELRKIGELAIKYNFYIISDEIYEKLIYDNEHVSIASISESIKNRTIVINGVSKAYAMTGWRIGYMAAPEKIAKLAVGFQGHTTSNPNSIAQKAVIAALNLDNKILDSMVLEFKKRRDYMYKKLSKIDKFILPDIPGGAFYIFVNIEKIGKNSEEVSEEILDIAKVGVVPGAAFGMDGFIRFSYANSLDEIEEGINRIEKLYK
ncbi:pyridoxal phosphate-dependent aminotransferase [Haliovirga abyssi]|uniref:Aminotransferase n=1 Tax=Haliovirga abyssi TaxID=2996794 RepID=A0AAU9DJ43_9FUSO|nr:pyridoxal phosphate-dependent aminotransferase [Haliovirga abyssi]BDU50789.1 aminotransferase [Haliovirga abyssi]